jgi:hypothetical protein
MSQLINKSDLSEPERQLVELLQNLDFGRIEVLQVRRGRPVLDPAPRVVATLKMKAGTLARDEAHPSNFSLKQSVVLLLLLMKQIEDGVILVIEVRHGLPVTVEVDGAIVRPKHPSRVGKSG